MDRIVPADQDPSATGLGADAFLLRLLRLKPELVAVYRQGLDALDGAGFAEMSPAEQDAALERREAERDPFFALLVQQTLEGVYADPGNGGNRNGRAWEMVGFEVTA